MVADKVRAMRPLSFDLRAIAGGDRSAIGAIDEINPYGFSTPVPSLGIPLGRDGYIRGWIFDPNEETVGALVLIDDQYAVEATYWLPRTDLAALYGDDRLGSGFELRFASNDIGIGVHRATAVCVTKSGTYSTAGWTSFRVLPATPELQIVPSPSPITIETYIDEFRSLDDAVAPELLPPRIENTGIAYVRGWSIDAGRGMPCSGVVACVDGRHWFSAVYGLSRPDVAAAQANDAVIFCGYELRFFVQPLGPGVHELKFLSLSADGDGHAFANPSRAFVVT